MTDICKAVLIWVAMLACVLYRHLQRAPMREWFDPPIYKRMSWICVPLSLALANMWAFVHGLELIPEVHVEFI